jgi:hypothetical protein
VSRRGPGPYSTFWTSTGRTYRIVPCLSPTFSKLGFYVNTSCEQEKARLGLENLLWVHPSTIFAVVDQLSRLHDRLLRFLFLFDALFSSVEVGSGCSPPPDSVRAVR